MTESVSSKFCWYAAGQYVGVDVGRSFIAHVGGIKRCGSPWACPMCAPVIRERRAHEIDVALREALDRQWSVLFLTLTMRHHRGDSLAPRLDAVSTAVRRVLVGSSWQRRKDRLGYVGQVRAVEVTWGERNGWHPHVHVALVFKASLGDDELTALRLWIEGRWARVVEREGFGTINEHGVDLRRVTSAGDLAGYLCKVEGGWSAGHELARGDRKNGLTPFSILSEFAETGEVRLADLWREYERATFGHRAIKMSPGLRAELLSTDEEASDLELAASEGADVTLLRAFVHRSVWQRRWDEDTVGLLLNDIENHAALLIVWAEALGYVVPALDGAPSP
jgi:hypothetical protein